MSISEIDNALNLLDQAITNNVLDMQPHTIDLAIMANLIDKIKNNNREYDRYTDDKVTSSDTETSSAPINDDVSVSNVVVPTDLYNTTN